MSSLKNILSWDIKKIADALKISIEDTIAYFTDGRRVSFILERRIAKEVIKGTLAQSEGAGYDLIDKDGKKWEVRSITRGGIYFCPSYMVGSGRHFEESGFLNKLDEMEGFIVSDVVKFPNIPYWILSSKKILDWWNEGRLGPSSKISRIKALELLSNQQLF